MASEAFAGVGCQFKVGNGAATEAFTPLSEITSINGLDLTKTTIDVTNLDSIAGYREWIPGFRDSGTLTLAMNFTIATYGTLKALFDSTDLSNNFQIVFADDGDTTFDFAAFIQTLGPINVTPDAQVTANCVLKVTSIVDLTS
jgi:hypothetical protein